MENNNKYLQEARILNKSVFYDNDGNEQYQYTVFVNMWNTENKRYEPVAIYIKSTNNYDFGDKINLKRNKSLAGNIYFTEYQETPFDI